MPALATALAVAAAVVAGASGVASASVAPHHPARPGAPAAPHSGLTLAQAPAGLRAAVRKTLGTRDASGGSAVQKGVLTASDGASGDQFGVSVAISGSTAVVGAPYRNTYTGAVYVFVRTGGTWLEQATLTAPDGSEAEDFGSSVAISGSTVVVGAEAAFDNAGVAFVFSGSGGTWSQQAELTGPGLPNDAFGWSVAISGDTAVVGAPGAGAGTGAAYVYTGPGGSWSQQAQLTPAGGTPTGGDFGTSVAISGSTAVVGADAANGNAGAAYVFTGPAGTWSQQAKLTASGGDFGFSVAISGSTAIVGAPGVGRGAAYVFADSGGTWSQQAELTAPGDVSGSDFGTSVAISGSAAVVGGAGAAYVSTRSSGTWSQAGLTASGSEFGWSVAIAGSMAVVGAPGTNSLTGAVYAFALPSQQARLAPSSRDANEAAGTSVALSGSTAVVGAPGQHSATGAAYIYVRSGSTWSQQAELTAPGGVSGVDFGISVALSGSTAVVGAPGTTSGTGAAYVYGRSGTTWYQQAELTAPGGVPGDIFGHAVAISGSTAVIGAYGTSAYSGTAYVFTRSAGTWHQKATLTDPGATADDFFGYSVATSGSTAVIGAYGTNAATGAAYVFADSGGTWSQQATLTDSGATPGDSFGFAAAISGTTAVIGAPGTNSLTGAAYVFTGPGGTWSPQATLTAAGGGQGDDFGYSVTLSGTSAVVGAPRQGSRTGTAYLFADPGGTWSQQAGLTAASHVTGGQFGYSVALAGTTAVMGAPGENSSTGAAYVFANV